MYTEVFKRCKAFYYENTKAFSLCPEGKVEGKEDSSVNVDCTLQVCYSS